MKPELSPLRSFFRRRFFGLLADERGDFGGFIVLAGVVALAGAVYLAIFQGTADQGIKALAKAQVIRVKTNYDALVSEFGEIKPDTPIPANDSRVLEIKDAISKLKAFAEEVRDKARNAVEASITQNAIDTLNQATACVVDPPTPGEGSASQAKAISVRVQARVPLPKDTSGVSLTSDKGDTGSIDACGPPSCSTPFTWIGKINLIAKDPSLSGKTTQIQVSGPNIACNAVAFRWLFTPPKIQSFTKTPTIPIQPGTTVTLTWETQNAQGADINGTVVGNPARGVMEVSPNETTDYILTAVSTNPAEPNVYYKDSAKLKVEVTKPSFAVTLSSGGNDVTTDFSVTVGGKVTPVPPDGTLVAIGVNGALVTTASVGGDGSYFATVTLPKTTSIGRLALTNPGVNVFACGGFASAVTLANKATAADVANVFTATVFKDGGGVDSNVATLQVTHAVKITSATVSWSGQCPGPDEDLGAGGKIVRGGDVLQLGNVTCGVPCPAPSTKCTATARSSVSTTVGSLFVDALWNIAIP